MITRFKCKECKEVKTEIWLICDSEHGNDWCELCRERSKREDPINITGNETFVYNTSDNKTYRMNDNMSWDAVL